MLWKPLAHKGSQHRLGIISIFSWLSAPLILHLFDFEAFNLIVIRRESNNNSEMIKSGAAVLIVPSGGQLLLGDIGADPHGWRIHKEKILIIIRAHYHLISCDPLKGENTIFKLAEMLRAVGGDPSVMGILEMLPDLYGGNTEDTVFGQKL